MWASVWIMYKSNNKHKEYIKYCQTWACTMVTDTPSSQLIVFWLSTLLINLFRGIAIQKTLTWEDADTHIYLNVWHARKKQVDQGFILWFLGHHTSKECTCICIFVTWMIFPWEHNPVTSMSLKTSSHVVGKTGLQSPYSIAVELNQWIDCRGLHNSDQEHYLTLSYDSLAWIKQVIINYLCSNKGPHCKNLNR